MRLLLTAGEPDFETDEVADDGGSQWFHRGALRGPEAFLARAPRDLVDQGVSDEWSRCACDLGGTHRPGSATPTGLTVDDQYKHENEILVSPKPPTVGVGL